MKKVNKELKKYIDENIFPIYKKNDLETSQTFYCKKCS